MSIIFINFSKFFIIFTFIFSGFSIFFLKDIFLCRQLQTCVFEDLSEAVDPNCRKILRIKLFFAKLTDFILNKILVKALKII